MDDAKTENSPVALTTEPNPSTENASRSRPSEGEYVVVRKRRRKRTTTAASLSTTQRRTRYLLLGLIGFLLVVSLAGASTIRRSASTLFHTLFPRVSFKGGSLRVEVIALIIAAVVVLYLIPGVEDRVLRFLGLRKDRKR